MKNIPMYADSIQIYVDASKDARQLEHLLPRQLPDLNWDDKLKQYVSITPDIRFLIECCMNKDIESHRQRFEDEHRYLLYPVIIQMWTFTELDLSHPQVLADQKQIAQ